MAATFCQPETLPCVPIAEAKQAGHVLRVPWEFLARVQDSWHWAGVAGAPSRAVPSGLCSYLEGADSKHRIVFYNELFQPVNRCMESIPDSQAVTTKLYKNLSDFLWLCLSLEGEAKALSPVT